jgi:short-subunit dehydrogenase
MLEQGGGQVIHMASQLGIVASRYGAAILPRPGSSS